METAFAPSRRIKLSGKMTALEPLTPAHVAQHLSASGLDPKDFMVTRQSVEGTAAGGSAAAAAAAAAAAGESLGAATTGESAAAAAGSESTAAAVEAVKPAAGKDSLDVVSKAQAAGLSKTLVLLVGGFPVVVVAPADVRVDLRAVALHFSLNTKRVK
jgi:hypothetical protein